jgi:hypothetical protein
MPVDNSLNGANKTHIVERLEPYYCQKTLVLQVLFFLAQCANGEILAVDFVDQRR